MSSYDRSRRLRRRALAAGTSVALVAAAVVTALATASAGAAVAHRPAARQATVSGCATAALKVQFVNKGNGAAGTIYYPIKFTNKGSRACTLRGFPGVSAVPSTGKQIGNPAVRAGGKVKTVTINPNKSASAMVGIVHTAFFPKAKCKPVRAAGLRVFPPNQTKAVIVKHKFSTCASKKETSLKVIAIG